jgi:chromosome segregation ATPase
MKNKSGPATVPEPPKPEPSLPEVKTRAQAVLLDGMYSRLWDAAESLRTERDELRKGWDEAAAAANLREQKYLAQISELTRRLDDTEQTLHATQEKLILAHEDSAALRNEILHMETMTAGAGERVRAARDNAFIDRSRQPQRDVENIENIRAIETALNEVAEAENRKNNPPAEPQPPRLDMRPVETVRPRRPTVMPDEEIDR